MASFFFFFFFWSFCLTVATWKMGGGHHRERHKGGVAAWNLSRGLLLPRARMRGLDHSTEFNAPKYYYYDWSFTLVTFFSVIFLYFPVCRLTESLKCRESENKESRPLLRCFLLSSSQQIGIKSEASAGTLLSLISSQTTWLISATACNPTSRERGSAAARWL